MCVQSKILHVSAKLSNRGEWRKDLMTYLVKKCQENPGEKKLSSVSVMVPESWTMESLIVGYMFKKLSWICFIRTILPSNG